MGTRLGRWLAATWLVCSAAAEAKQAAPCKPVKSVDAGTQGVRALAMAKDGKTFLVAGEDGSVRVLDAKTGKQKQLLKGHTAAVYAVAVSPDGALALTGSEDKKAILWDLKTGKQRAVLAGHLNTVRGVAFSSDGATAYTVSLDKQMGSWDVATGKLNGMLGGQACVLMGLAVSGGTLKDGAPAAGTACNDGLVRVWNLKTGKPTLALDGHDGEVHAVAFAPGADNPLMATGDNENKVIIWDIGKKVARQTFENVGWTDVVAFSPDGAVLVSAGNDGAQKGLFKLWDVVSGKMLNEQFPHEGTVPAVAFSPDGKTLFTGGMDGVVKTWDVPQLVKGCGP